MIDWNLTKQQFNRSDLSGNRPKVVVSCDKCGATAITTIRSKKKAVGNQIPWECNKCIANRPEKRAKSSQGALKGWSDLNYRNTISKSSEDNWKDPELKTKMDLHARDDYQEIMFKVNRAKAQNPEFCAKIAERMKKQWQDPEYRNNILQKTFLLGAKMQGNPSIRLKTSERMLKLWDNANYKDMMQQAMVKHWQDPEFQTKMLTIFASDAFRNKMSDANKAVWARPGYKERMLPILARCSKPKASYLQLILYSILDDLNIKYFREYVDKSPDSECIIGGFRWDCVIPQLKNDLLIECNGNYWHMLPHIKIRDAMKANYVEKNSDKYGLKIIWEHEFYSPYKVRELIKYWMNVDNITIDFDFNGIIIKDCPTDECRMLLSKYSHLANAGKGGIKYGAYYNNELAAVVVFSPVLEHDNSPYTPGQIRELSRVCIHPKYLKQGFVPWLINQCLGRLSDYFKLIISRCDTTFGCDRHALESNKFIIDGELPADYWYISEDAWPISRQSLHRNATRLMMSDDEFAESYRYTKVDGEKGLRFIYKR